MQMVNPARLVACPTISARPGAGRLPARLPARCRRAATVSSAAFSNPLRPSETDTQAAERRARESARVGAGLPWALTSHRLTPRPVRAPLATAGALPAA